MYRRNLLNAIERSLTDTPVVLLAGPRQVGKTTLAQQLGERRFLTLDEGAVLAAAKLDPDGFVAGLDGPIVLDEIQRAPELFRAIKLAVDRKRTPGRFLLTGSANVLLLPKLSDSLAGRMVIHTLWPLSQGELGGVHDDLVAALFAMAAPASPPARLSRRDLWRRIARGGFPEATTRAAPDRRAAWFAAYLTTVLQRDVRDLANVDGLAHLPRLLALLAARVGSLVNVSEVSRTLAMSNVTLTRYLALLEATYLLALLPAWSSNLGKRLAKSPKLYLADAGLAAHLQGVAAAPTEDLDRLGPLLENFVVMELRKQLGWTAHPAEMFHFRTHTGAEVDVVLEDSAGRVCGIEIKAAATVQPRMLDGLRALEAASGRRFHRGIILYGGDTVVPFAKNLHAVPVASIWSW